MDDVPGSHMLVAVAIDADHRHQDMVADMQTAISACLERLTLRVTWRTVPSAFSMMLVQASERRSSSPVGG